MADEQRAGVEGQTPSLNIDAVAREVALALAVGRQIAPYSRRGVPLDMAGAYQAVAALRRLRPGRVVGRKIGFTNSSLWERYGVSAPMWGDITEHTLVELSELDAGLKLAGLCEPRIEPEVALGLGRAPQAGMDEAELLSCVAWAAPAFEIVQSIYPGWNFAGPDTVAAGGLHGRLALGPRVSTDGGWAKALPDLTLNLRRGAAVVDTGVGSNVLGGPILALRHLVELLAVDPVNPPLQPGDVITTGTLTDAWPVSVGETWSADFEGVPLGSISVRFI